KITGQLMSDPNVLAAFGRKLDSMAGQRSGYIETLPKSMKRRLRALKKLQLEVFNVEAKFYEEVHLLEHKYADLYKPLLQKRRDIISAVKEPTDSDCDYQSDNDEEEEDEACKDGEGDKQQSKDYENTKGIPEFWLTIFKNVEILSNLVQEQDEEPLKKLQDIRVIFSDQVEEMYFELHFDFDENDYFEDKTLVKRYYTRSSPDPSAPMTYDGPEIVKCTGCKINWKKDKNLTEKSIKQKVKGKGGAKKVVNKTVKQKSFFNFFSPPDPPGLSTHVNDEKEAILLADFEVGQLLQSSLVPKAVLYFTGEALDDDIYDEDEDG
ncbi:hypothetical protein HELRODRAFT_150433, partial [Helobdella robusta]|uniref:Nucleosome assembly protein 1-like 1 n=1 Tax=Helobdella robusta TaxID=6412 RepID=T1EKF7_HELRO